jgi:outer membrane protein assembly factor BamD (BamD/ComL family)
MLLLGGMNFFRMQADKPQNNAEINADIVATELYQEGVANFERGDYQKAIATLERAKNIASFDTKLGGDILIWLANAYDAIGKTEQAIDLCRRLQRHPTGSIRKNARYMLGIFTAPQLSKLEGVVSEVPLLQSPDRYEARPARTNKSKDKQPFREVSLERPNNNVRNNFLWLAIAIFLIALAILA